MSNAFDIPPDAVRVFRGFRATTLAVPDFLNKLGSVFIPATAEMQAAAGLDAYISSVPAGLPGKPDTVPDETAVLFWDSPQCYEDAFKTLAVRTYTLTHGPVYRKPSTAGFPAFFSGTLAAEKPCYLIDRPADWMLGTVTHLVGSRPQGASADQFRTQLCAILSNLQNEAGVAGAIACAGDDYFLYWELDAGAGSSGVAALKACLDWSHVFTPAPKRLAGGLWDQWPGLSVPSGASFNLHFQRRWQAVERDARPVAPDAVHVWRGYKLPTLSEQDFRAFLGRTFVPAALLLQPGAGLHAYVPSVIPGGGKSAPDQTALMFWTDPQAYKDAYGKVAVRAYKGLHGSAFAEPPSETGFPVALKGTVLSEQPYHLFDGPADWMLGTVRHFVGTRPTQQTAAAFLHAVSAWAVSYRDKPPQRVDGALLCAGETYVAFWELVPAGDARDNSALTSLTKLAEPALSQAAENYIPPAGLWNAWDGIDLSVHSCLNIQLNRPSQS